MISAMSRTPRVITALMLREMSTTYGKSPGGYLWVVVEPVAGIAVLSVVFAMLVRSPPLGDVFPLFYGTGVMLFSVYGDISGKIGAAIRFSKPLLAYPAVTFMDAILARLILNGLTQALVCYLVMGGIVVIFDVQGHMDLPVVALAFCLAVAVGFGIGVLNCCLFAFYPLYQRVWGILTRPLLIISGVFYLYESLPRTVQDILWFNPLVHVIGLMRTGVYQNYTAEYVSFFYVGAWIVIPSITGLYFLKRYHRVILYEL